MRRDAEKGNMDPSQTLLNKAVKVADIEDETPPNNPNNPNSLKEENSCCSTVLKKLFFWRVRKKDLERLMKG